MHHEGVLLRDGIEGHDALPAGDAARVVAEERVLHEARLVRVRVRVRARARGGCGGAFRIRVTMASLIKAQLLLYLLRPA